MPLKELDCSNCGTKVKKRVSEESINITNNPKIISEIIDGKINYSTCPNCKEKINHKTHVLLTYLNPPRWIWLVDRKHQNPGYQDEFFKTIIPNNFEGLIEQEMVFVEFGEPCNCLQYVLNEKQPQTCEDWLGLGKLFTGKKAVECYKNALKINEKIPEAKKLMYQEMDKLKTYS